jgi:tryptophanyl-tRNA synthetase
MSKTVGNVIPMFASQKVVKKAVMAIVTDSTPVEDPKDFGAPVFQLWSLFATPAERQDMKERAARGGLGYGDVKQDLLRRMLEYFGPMRERREGYAKRPDELEDILARGAVRARRIAATVLSRCREAAGFKP